MDRELTFWTVASFKTSLLLDVTSESFCEDPKNATASFRTVLNRRLF